MISVPHVLCLLLALAPAFAAFAAEDVYAKQRAAFKQALQRAESGQELAGAADSETLREYPLYPYLQAARIRRALNAATVSAATDAVAQQFIQTYGSEPVGRDLRRVWLNNLAKRKQWPTFLEHFNDENADPTLRCHAFTARIELGKTDGLIREVSSLWLTPSRLTACATAFDWLRAQQALSHDLIEQRVRGALRAGNVSFARQFIGSLPAERSAPLNQWSALLENPAGTIDKIIAGTRALDDEALLAGWTRLTRRNREAALARYERLVRSQQWSAEQASPYARALALSLSWDRRAESLTFFKRVAAQDLDDSTLEWQARAALWAGDWSLVSRSIAAMSAEQRATARWRYWNARAVEQNDANLARQLYASVLPDDNYYSGMAAARLDRPVTPHLQKLPLDPVLIEQVAAVPALVRAYELLQLEMRSQAIAEWLAGYGSLNAEARQQAVHLASRWGWRDRAIATAAQQRIFNDYELLYPRPFDKEVRAAAQLTSLPVDLIYGVMRQESLYQPDVVSSAGAVGLLQLLPETARRTAQQWQRPRPSTADLKQPAVNIPLGAGFLKGLHDRFRGQTPVALAGYNAGPNAARRWLPPSQIDADIWIENIPYNETRTYVQRILWHSLVFAWLRTGEPQHTATWIAHIAPFQDTAVAGMNAGS